MVGLRIQLGLGPAEEVEVSTYSEELGAFSVGRDGTIVMVSPRALEMIGYELFEVLGKNFSEFVADGSLPLAMEAFATTLEGKPTEIELELRKKDGGTIRVRARSSPDRVDDQVLGSIGTVEEVG